MMPRATVALAPTRKHRTGTVDDVRLLTSHEARFPLSNGAGIIVGES
jgi:hypothetical protein